MRRSIEVASLTPVPMWRKNMAAAVGRKKMTKPQEKPIKENGKNLQDSKDFMLENVIKLGGSKEDFEMLKGVKELVKDAEQSKISVNESSFKNEIQSLVESLGLENMIMESESDDDDDDDDGDNEGDVSKLEADAKSTKKAKTGKKNEENYIPKFDKLKKMIIKPDALWHEQIPDAACVQDKMDTNHETVIKVQEIARQYWENEVALYQERKNNEKSSDANWLRTVLSSGTLSDRVAAATMVLQESPLHQVTRLESLITMAKKKGRREAIMAIDSLRNLWTTSLLPDRKLKHFWQWPLSNIKELSRESGKNGESSLLVLWYFEDLLKARCAEFVDLLENLSRDTIPGIRDKTAGIMHELLAVKPEQEQRLLTAIVNKLGDPTRKVASRASYLLGQLVIKHPNMKMTVIQEVERLIYRPNVAQKAQYYAICFLNQLILTKSENLVASKLISIYFSFFKAYAAKDSTETKMLSALLSGVNRAFPYAKDSEEKYEDQLNMLFKICHTSNFHTSVQALMLLYQVTESRKIVADRYYKALYEKLFDIGINTTTKRTMFLNIIYKSMKSDPSLNRIKAFFKRLLQAAAFEEPSFVCGLLYLLSEVLKLSPGVKGLILQPEEEDDEEHFEDIAENNFTAPNEKEMESEAKANEAKSDNTLKQGWTFRDGEVKRSEYDPTCRNPLFCGAQFSSAWEVHPLLRHYHPSVNHFAESVLQDKSIDYKGDPLQDFTLVRFLDRFMYKNPKKKVKDHGSSIMQPRKVSARSMELPVNTKNFADMKIDKIRKDEMFYYRYFRRKAELDAAKKGKKKATELMDNLKTEDDHELQTNDFDFASEMHKSKDTEPKGRKRKSRDEDEIDGDDDDEDDDEGEDEDISDQDFNYSDMEISEDEDFDESFDLDSQPMKKKNFTDADYEKALLENLSDSDVNEEDGGHENAKAGNDKISSMFAAAEEFAHLLEGSELSKGQKKQSKWESRNKDWTQKEKEKPNSLNKKKTNRTGESGGMKAKDPRRNVKQKSKANRKR